MIKSEGTFTRWRDDIHYRWLSWFVVVHVLGLAGFVYAYAYAEAPTIVFAVAYFFFGHLAITCGAHRLYSHKAFEAGTVLQYGLLLAFSAVAQGPMAWWVGVHRRHHHKEGTREDFHDPLQYGFWRSHVGWMCTREGVNVPPQSYMRFGRKETAPLKWQYENYRYLMVAMTFGVPAAVCSLWGDPWGGLLVGGFARLIPQYHLTWVINSLCHLYGTRIEGGGTATNIPLLGPLTVGESYHADHHKDPTNWRLGRNWYDLDPGKWLISLLFILGLAKPVRRRIA